MNVSPVAPMTLTEAYEFQISTWSTYDHLVAVVDDPALSPSPGGVAIECDELDNEVVIDLSGLCP